MSSSPSIQPLSRERHGNKRWRPTNNHFGFAIASQFAPLAANEVAKAALSLPLAFVKNQDEFQMVAVLGISPDRNLFVAPNGRWLAGYLPAVFKFHPFRLGRVSETGEAVLCVDETSDLITEDTGELFFKDADNLGAATAECWANMVENLRGQTMISKICAKLDQAGIIAPWPIRIRDGENERTLENLYQIDEAALNGLDDAGFCGLRHAGGLTLAYAQLFSSGHIARFGELVAMHGQVAQAEAKRAEAADKPSDPGGELSFGDSLDIDWSKVGG